VKGSEKIKTKYASAVFDAIIRNTSKLIPFIVPDEKIIDMFTEHVLPILNQIDVLSTQNKKAKISRDLILPRLMNGEIVV